MPFRIKVSLIIVALLLFTVVVVPLIVPIPAVKGTKPLAEAAAGAELLTVNGVQLRVLDRAPAAERTPAGGAAAPTADGQPAAAVFVLLHDYAFNSASFEPIVDELSQYGRVVAFDRPGFGLSERPLPERGQYDAGYDPYEPSAQVDFTVGVMDALGAESAVLIGNGLGGRVAIDVALAHPELVAGLVLVDTPAFQEETKQAPGWVLNSPQMRRLGPVFLRQLGEAPGEQLLTTAFADPTKITDEGRAGYALTTSVDDWDRALWEYSRAGKPTSLEGRLGAVLAPTLVVAATGGVFPLSEGERLADELPNGALVELADCGRLPQLECPAELMAVLSDWLGSVAAGQATD